MIIFNPFTHVLPKFHRNGVITTTALNEASAFIGFKLGINKLQLNTVYVIEEFKSNRIAIEFCSERIPHSEGNGFSLDYNIKNIEIHKLTNSAQDVISTAQMKSLLVDYFNTIGWNIPNIKEKISKLSYHYFKNDESESYQCCGLKIALLNDNQFVYTLSDYNIDNLYKDYELVLNVYDLNHSIELRSRVTKQNKYLLFTTHSLKQRNKYINYLMTLWLNFKYK